jgi:hypothetical protein
VFRYLAPGPLTHTSWPEWIETDPAKRPGSAGHGVHGVHGADDRPGKGEDRAKGRDRREVLKRVWTLLTTHAQCVASDQSLTEILKGRKKGRGRNKAGKCDADDQRHILP